MGEVFSVNKNRPPQSTVTAVGGSSMYSCFYGLPLRFDAIHHCIHQFQLLFGGTGHFFDHLLGMFRVEAGQRFLQFFFALLCPGQDQEYFYVCPSFLRTGSIYAAKLVHYPSPDYGCAPFTMRKHRLLRSIRRAIRSTATAAARVATSSPLSASWMA